VRQPQAQRLQKTRVNPRGRLNIPIMYLPKSYPPTPPLYHIPLPTPAHSMPSDPRVRSVKLAMQWPKGLARRNDSECSVFVRVVLSQMAL
jgi:hypothetical protein